MVVKRSGEDLKMEVKIKRVLSSLLSVSKRGLRPFDVFLLRGCNVCGVQPGSSRNTGACCAKGDSRFARRWPGFLYSLVPGGISYLPSGSWP